MVADLTRSIAYIFPMLILSVLILKEHITVYNFRILSIVVAMFCFIYPDDFYVYYQQPTLIKGIHIKVLDKLISK